MRSIGSVRWSPKPTSPKNPSFEATPPCYRFRGREPPRDRPQARASRPRAALPFAPNATTIVCLAAVSGVATGFFRPAVYAGLPNLVSDRDLPRANSLLQVIDNSTWAIGSLIGGALVAARGPHLAYWINAATFLISAALIAQIGQRRLQGAEGEDRVERRHGGQCVRQRRRAVPSDRHLFSGQLRSRPDDGVRGSRPCRRRISRGVVD